MTAPGAEPQGAASGTAGRPTTVVWPWVFGLIFVLLTSSAYYFASRPVALARRMDSDRSSLTRDGAGAVLARILVLGVPSDGQVRARLQAPTHAEERWRIDIEWTAEPAARVDTPGGERQFEVRVAAPVTEVEVWDRRGGVAPERMLLSLPPDEAR